MASSNTLSYDDDPTHRPALSELGGGAKENDPEFPPDPVKHIKAEDINQASKQIEAFGRVAPLAIVWVRNVAGTPAIFAVQALGANVVAGSFTVTDTGTGDTLISWKTGLGAASGALPAVVGVVAMQTDDVEVDRIRAILTSSGGDPAAQVVTKIGAAAADCNFCLMIF